MCGRFTLSSPGDVVAELFGLPDVPEIAPRYNIAPTQPIAAIRVTMENSDRQLVLLRWGLIPPWADEIGIGARMINARAETVATGPAFRSALRRRRCLVIADGFYEWKKPETTGGRVRLPGGHGKRARPHARSGSEYGTRRKQPFYIRLRSGLPFAFAGLWERWESPAESGDAPDQAAGASPRTHTRSPLSPGSRPVLRSPRRTWSASKSTRPLPKREQHPADMPPAIESCTIITTEPNDLLASLHDRMPVILHPRDYSVWLDPEARAAGELKALLRPYPADELEAYPVSTRVNAPSVDTPECIEPLA